MGDVVHLASAGQLQDVVVQLRTTFACANDNAPPATARDRCRNRLPVNVLRHAARLAFAIAAFGGGAAFLWIIR